MFLCHLSSKRVLAHNSLSPPRVALYWVLLLLVLFRVPNP